MRKHNVTSCDNKPIKLKYRKQIPIFCDYAPQTYETLEHKTSLKCQFFEIEIHTSSESWINNISIDAWFVMIGQYLKIWNLREQTNLNIEKIIFKVVQMKFLAMHITNQQLSFDIFTVGNLLNIFMEHDFYLIS